MIQESLLRVLKESHRGGRGFGNVSSLLLLLLLLLFTAVELSLGGISPYTSNK